MTKQERKLLKEKARRAVGRELADDPYEEMDMDCYWNDLAEYIGRLIAGALEAHGIEPEEDDLRRYPTLH